MYVVYISMAYGNNYLKKESTKGKIELQLFNINTAYASLLSLIIKKGLTYM